MASLRRENGREAPFNVKYWGIGNEAWGCGGNMRAEYYADLCRQYSTYLRSYSPDHKIYKIASGANVDDYHWTRTVLERAGHVIDAVSLHYYTLPHQDWQHKGSATEFTESEYYTTLHKTLRMEELVENHSRIIRQFAGGRKSRSGCGRVGHLVRCGAGHESGLPLPAEHDARCAGGGNQPEHLQ